MTHGVGQTVERSWCGSERSRLSEILGAEERFSASCNADATGSVFGRGGRKPVTLQVGRDAERPDKGLGFVR